MLGLAGLLALLFLPLSFVVATWVSNLSQNSKSNLCESENKETQYWLTNYIDQLFTWSKGYQENNFSAFTNEILIATPVKIKGSAFIPMNIDYNERLAKELGLGKQSLALSLQPALLEITKKSMHSKISVAASQIQKLSLWTFGFKMSETDLLLLTVYPRQFIKHAQSNMNCDFAVFNSAGQSLHIRNRLNTDFEPNQLFTFTLKNPLNSQTESLHLSANTDTQVQIRATASNLMVATITDMTGANEVFRRVLIVFAALAVIAFLIALIPLSRTWFTELQTAKMMTSTVEAFATGNYLARPRLFLNDQFADLEHSIDKLGLFLEEFKTLGASLAKSGLSPSQLRDFSKKSQAREVVSLSLYLPPLSDSAGTASEALSLYNEIAEVFARTTKKNSGIVDFTTPQHLQSVWGFISESEFDSANAGMTALELRVGLSNINERLLAAKMRPLAFGIGVHRAPAQIAVMGSEQTKSLSIIGDPNYESLSLARLSSQIKIEILISEVMATLIEPYFVLGSAPELPIKEARLYTIQGYIDNQENPVLIRSRKTN